MFRTTGKVAMTSSLFRAGSEVEHVKVRHHQPRALPRGRQATLPVSDPARQSRGREHSSLEDRGGSRPCVPLERRIHSARSSSSVLLQHSREHTVHGSVQAYSTTSLASGRPYGARRPGSSPGWRGNFTIPSPPLCLCLLTKSPVH